MTILEGSKADVLRPQFGGTAVFSGVFNVTDIATVIPNFQLDLPRAGKYLLIANALGHLEISAGAEALILFDVTHTPIAGGSPVEIPVDSIAVSTTQTGVLAATVGSLSTVVDIPTPSKLEMLAVRGSLGSSPTFTTSQIRSIGLGFTTITAIRLL